jgi:hypothetical protein
MIAPMEPIRILDYERPQKSPPLRFKSNAPFITCAILLIAALFLCDWWHSINIPRHFRW